METWPHQCSRNTRQFNEDFTWKPVHVDIGDSLEFAGRIERSQYLFEHLPYPYTTLLRYKHAAKSTVKLSLNTSRYRTEEMMIVMECLRLFSPLQELSLGPPPSDFEPPVNATSLRLHLYYDRSSFSRDKYTFANRGGNSS